MFYCTMVRVLRSEIVAVRYRRPWNRKFTLDSLRDSASHTGGKSSSSIDIAFWANDFLLVYLLQYDGDKSAGAILIFLFLLEGG